MRRLCLVLLALTASTACDGEAATVRAMTAGGGEWIATTCAYRDFEVGRAGEEWLVEERDDGGNVELTFTTERNDQSAAYFSDWRTGVIVGPDGWATSFDWDATSTGGGDPQLWLYLYEEALLRQGEWYATFPSPPSDDRVELAISQGRGAHRYEVDLVLEPR